MGVAGNGVETGMKGGSKEGVYSVVFTTANEDTSFEVYVLKGRAKTPKEVSADVQKVKDWLDTLDRF